MKPQQTMMEQVTDFGLDQIIEDFFDQKIRDSDLIHPHYAELWKELKNLMLSGGKRLRPKLTMLAYQAYGGSDTASVAHIAFAQELLHLALLIHDDIIDRDYIRYGVQNISGTYAGKYTQLKDEDRLHYANAAAMLGGDLLLSSAYEVINTSAADAELKKEATLLLARSMFEVGGGELLDSESTFRDHGEGSELTIANYKTASYSFKGPLLTGALLARASAEQQQLLGEFALQIGIAYQLTDDMLGVFGDTTVMGKTTLGDIREGKKTFLIHQFYDRATNEEFAIFNQFFGDKSLDNEGLSIVKNLLVSSQAKQRTTEKIAQLEQRASHIADLLDVDSAYRDRFKVLIEKSVRRSL